MRGSREISLVSFLHRASTDALIRVGELSTLDCILQSIIICTVYNSFRYFSERRWTQLKYDVIGTQKASKLGEDSYPLGTHAQRGLQYLVCLSVSQLASFPGLPRGEGRPGTHCLRMREFYEYARHEILWACLRKRPKTHSCRL